jgi:hypothetical protein
MSENMTFKANSYIYRSFIARGYQDRLHQIYISPKQFLLSFTKILQSLDKLS